MVKNRVKELVLSYRNYCYYALYLLFIFIAVDNNSNLELMLKAGVLFIFLHFLNKSEVTNILLVFYRLFFIFYFLFFIFYFLADDESGKYLASTLNTLSIFILPGYILAYLVALVRDKMNFFTNIFFNIAVLVHFIISYFWYRSDIVSMTYSITDIFVFMLIILQLIVHYLSMKATLNMQ